jgi:hypothetical protein
VASLNPYTAPQSPGAEATQVEVPRTLLWSAIIAGQTLFYAGFVLAVGVMGFAVLLNPMMMSGARWDEVALLILVFVAPPFVLWFTVQEIKGIRIAIRRQEASLSRFSILCTLVPAAVSLHSFYEYFAFGSFAVNAVPGILAVGFAVVWLTIGCLRYRNARSSG